MVVKPVGRTAGSMEPLRGPGRDARGTGEAAIATGCRPERKSATASGDAGGSLDRRERDGPGPGQPLELASVPAGIRLRDQGGQGWRGIGDSGVKSTHPLISQRRESGGTGR